MQKQNLSPQNKNFLWEFFFSKVDLKYTDNQIPLQSSIQIYCNFKIQGSNKTREKIPNKNNYLEDILFITKGTEQNHQSELDSVPKRVDN